MFKIFISPERRTAPHGRYWGMDVYEHDLCCGIADRLKKLLERNGFEAYIAPPAWTMEQRANYANQSGFDYYLCIHTNAAGSGAKEGTATGCECLYYGKPGGASHRANQLAYDEITRLYPSRRGLKDGNAYAENRLTKMVSVYAELAFHDNGSDARWLVCHKGQLAEALCRAVCGYFGVEAVTEDKEDAGDGGEAWERIEELELHLATERNARQQAEQRANRAEGVIDRCAALLKGYR